MKKIPVVLASLFLGATSAIAGPATYEAQPAPPPQDENSHDLSFRIDFSSLGRC